MKYLSSKFEDYINKCNKFNLHKNSINLLKNNKKNIIIYGPSGIGKYTQSLNYIKEFSPTKLKYERKLNYNFLNKKDFIFKISDIHIEIDMELLGCNSKVLFNELYYQILDIFSTRENKFGIILCKNFHSIHGELLEIFYSYMQNINYKNIKIMYIILTEQISFIPNNILIRCDTISLARPSKTNYNKCIQKKIDKNTDINTIINIKNLNNDINDLNFKNSKYCKKIIDNMENYNKIQYLEFREILYDMLIYNINISNSIFCILKYLIKKNKINSDNINLIFEKLIIFFKRYNNNYRPIYHLENFFYYLCSIIHELR
jgi:hypothetical protein